MSEAGGSNRGFRKQKHQTEGSGHTKNEKKPFNKQKWREQHYSFKSKLDEHTEHRKKAAIRNYHKLLLKEDKNAPNPAIRLSSKRQPAKVDEKKKRFLELEAAKATFQRKLVKLKAQHTAKIEEQHRIRDTIANSRKRRTERFKKVSAKTKHGQPVMSGRIELMLQEIQQKVKGGQW